MNEATFLLGWALAGHGRVTEAEPLLNETWAGLFTTNRVPLDHMTSGIRILVQQLERQNLADELQKWKPRLSLCELSNAFEGNQAAKLQKGMGRESRPSPRYD